LRFIGALLAAVLALVSCSAEPPEYVSTYKFRVSIIGDSYTGGSDAGGYGDKGWPARAREKLRDAGYNTVLKTAAEGGSGYLQRGSKGGVFADQVSATVRSEDQLVVVFGSRNDDDFAIPMLTAAVHDTLIRIRTLAPGAKLLVVGPPWPSSSPTQRILQVRDTLQAQAKMVGAKFIDPISEQWFSNQPQLIGPDGVHPNDEGHALMADKIALRIAEQL